MALVLVWIGFALPLVVAFLLSFLPLDPALRADVLLSLLAPPVGSAAAIAGMLGLRTRLALLVSIALALLTPISIPCFATMLGLGIAFDMGALAIRLFSIVGAAGLVAFLAIRFHQNLMPFCPINALPPGSPLSDSSSSD
jgi:arsenite transporter